MERHLRVGLYQGGKLVDDRWIAGGERVSVGTSARNTFALPGSGLPAEHSLVQFTGSHAVLHVLEGMTGELALDGVTRQSLGELKGQGADAASGWTLELPETVRGWVSVGNTVILLQITTRPSPPPPVPLPSSVRTGLFGTIEKTFVGILVAVLAVEAVALVAIHQRPEVDPDGAVSIENLDRFAEIIMPDLPRDKPVQEQADEGETAEKAPVEEKETPQEAESRDEAVAANPDQERDPAAEAARRERLREEVRQQGLLQVIGATGGSGGSLANVFASSTGFSDDIGAALAGAGGVAVATGNDAPQRRGGGTGDEVVGIGDLGSAAGGGRSTTLARQQVVPPQISIDDSEFETESSSVSSESLSQYIRPRLRSVQQCYERELKRNPDLAGRIVVRFVISMQGRVAEVTIEENSMGDDNVAACITNTIRRWIFPIKPEEEAAVSFPFVFSPGG